MFDIGFSELVIIAIVALVVIGPERLPTAARTLGALLGRLNRYVSDVKADVQREMRLEEMKKLRAEVEAQAMDIEKSVVQDLEKTRSALSETAADAGRAIADTSQSLTEVMRETGQLPSAEAPEASRPAIEWPDDSPLAHLQKNRDNATLAATDAAVAPESAPAMSETAVPPTPAKVNRA